MTERDNKPRHEEIDIDADGGLYWCELFMNGMPMTGEWDGKTREAAEASCVKR